MCVKLDPDIPNALLRTCSQPNDLGWVLPYG